MKIEESLDKQIVALIGPNKSLANLYADFAGSAEYRETCEAANDLVEGRMGYNDHGIVHGKIVARNALRIYSILAKRDVVADFIAEKGGNEEDVKLILLLSSLLHDVGNSIHRAEHFLHSSVLAANMMEGLDINPKKKLSILECVYGHDESIEATSIEASIVKIADALDMEGGRARIPFNKGHMDIHTVSALAIKRIEILEGKQKPLMLKITMSCISGIFQVQEMLIRQIRQGKLSDYIDLQVEMTKDSSCGIKLADVLNKKLL